MNGHRGRQFVKTIHVDVTDEMHALLVDVAKREERSVSALVRLIVRQYCQEGMA